MELQMNIHTLEQLTQVCSYQSSANACERDATVLTAPAGITYNCDFCVLELVWALDTEAPDTKEIQGDKLPKDHKFLASLIRREGSKQNTYELVCSKT